MPVTEEDPYSVATDRIGFLDREIIADDRRGRFGAIAMALDFGGRALEPQRLVRQGKRRAVIKRDGQSARRL